MMHDTWTRPFWLNFAPGPGLRVIPDLKIEILTPAYRLFFLVSNSAVSISVLPTLKNIAMKASQAVSVNVLLRTSSPGQCAQCKLEPKAGMLSPICPDHGCSDHPCALLRSGLIAHCGQRDRWVSLLIALS